jgi:hypothetical protein
MSDIMEGFCNETEASAKCMNNGHRCIFHTAYTIRQSVVQTSESPSRQEHQASSALPALYSSYSERQNDNDSCYSESLDQLPTNYLPGLSTDRDALLTDLPQSSSALQITQDTTCAKSGSGIEIEQLLAEFPRLTVRDGSTDETHLCSLCSVHTKTSVNPEKLMAVAPDHSYSMTRWVESSQDPWTVLRSPTASNGSAVCYVSSDIAARINPMQGALRPNLYEKCPHVAMKVSHSELSAAIEAPHKENSTSWQPSLRN